MPARTSQLQAGDHVNVRVLPSTQATQRILYMLREPAMHARAVSTFRTSDC